MASSRNNTLEFSSAGSQILGDGDASTSPSIGAIQCLQDTIFTTLTAKNIDTSKQVLTSEAFPAGTIIYGQFSSIVVNTGLVACHRV